MGGYADVGQSILVPSTDDAWTPTAEETFGYDPEKAKQLLDAAGYKDGDGDGVREDKQGKPIKLRLWTRSESPEQQRAGKLIAGSFESIGIGIDLAVMNDGSISDGIWTYKGSTYAPDYDMFIWGWSGNIDPDYMLADFITSQIEMWNDCCWSDKEYDSLYQQQAARDGRRRAQGPGHAHAADLLRAGALRRALLPEGPHRLQHRQVGRLGARTRTRTAWSCCPATTSTATCRCTRRRRRRTPTSSSSSTTWIVVGVVVAIIVILIVVAARAARPRARAHGVDSGRRAARAAAVPLSPRPPAASPTEGLPWNCSTSAAPTSRASACPCGRSSRAVDDGFAAKGRGQTEMPPKPGIHTRPDCFIHAMPAYVQELEVAGLKWVSGYPPNPARACRTSPGCSSSTTRETGVPLAVMDCAWITAMRTGASAGISAKYLARPDSERGRHRRLRRAGAHEPHGRWSRRCRPWPRCAATTSSRRPPQRFIAEMAPPFPALRFVACASARRRPCATPTSSSRPSPS